MNNLDRLAGGDPRGSRLFAWVGLGLVAVGLAHFLSPSFSLRSLAAAMSAGDAHALERQVDFPSVRAGLKDQLKAAMLANMAKDSRLNDNPFAGLAVALGPAVVDNVVDASVTPAGIVRLIQEGNLRAKNREPSGRADALDQNILTKGFISWDDYRVDFVSGAKLWMRPAFLFSWRVYKIEVPIDDAQGR